MSLLFHPASVAFPWGKIEGSRQLLTFSRGMLLTKKCTTGTNQISLALAMLITESGAFRAEDPARFTWAFVTRSRGSSRIILNIQSLFLRTDDQAGTGMYVRWSAWSCNCIILYPLISRMTVLQATLLPLCNARAPTFSIYYGLAHPQRRAVLKMPLNPKLSWQLMT